MSVASELFTALLAKYTADNGAGGLSGSGDTKVTFFLWGDDGNTDANQSVPRVAIEIIDQNMDAFSVGHSAVSFKMHLYFNRNREQIDGTGAYVESRLRTVFHRISLTAQATWTFSPPTMRRSVSVNSDGQTGHKVIDWQTTASKNSGV